MSHLGRGPSSKLVPFLPLSDSPPLVLPLKGTPVKDLQLPDEQALSGIPVVTKGPEGAEYGSLHALWRQSDRELSRRAHMLQKARENTIKLLAEERRREEYMPKQS